MAALAHLGGRKYTDRHFERRQRACRYPRLNAAFFEALQELGWVGGKNVVFKQRYAENRLLPEFAADLVRRKFDVIAAAGTLAPLAKALGLDLLASVLARADENFQIKEESNE